MFRPTLIERALQLASQGYFTERIIKTMDREGYLDTRAHLSGRAIAGQLIRARAAFTETASSATPS